MVQNGILNFRPRLRGGSFGGGGGFNLPRIRSKNGSKSRSDVSGLENTIAHLKVDFMRS